MRGEVAPKEAKMGKGCGVLWVSTMVEKAAETPADPRAFPAEQMGAYHLIVWGRMG